MFVCGRLKGHPPFNTNLQNLKLGLRVDFHRASHSTTPEAFGKALFGNRLLYDCMNLEDLHGWSVENWRAGQS